MKIDIEFLEDECAIINGKIVVAGDLSFCETKHLVGEYEKLRTSLVVYTPDAMEVKLGTPGFLARNIKNQEIGSYLGYMSETIEKISKDFCVLK